MQACLVGHVLVKERFKSGASIRRKKFVHSFEMSGMTSPNDIQRELSLAGAQPVPRLDPYVIRALPRVEEKAYGLGWEDILQ